MGRFDKYVDETDLDTSSHESTAVTVQPPPADSRSTTLATTPSEAKRERVAAGKEKLRQGLAADRADAALYGLQRGAAPGADRLAGIGADLGESVASLVHGLPAPEPDTAQKARDEYASKEAQASRDYPWTYFLSQVAGSVPMTVGAAGGGIPMAGTRPATIAQVAASPHGRLAAQNFGTGYMNSPSDVPTEQARAGLMSTAAGEILGVGGEKVGKFLGGAVQRKNRGLLKDIMMNSETEIAATPTARKRFMERAASATEEVKKDKALEKAIRSGEAEHAAAVAEAKLQIISEPRSGMYKQMDSIEMMTPAAIDAALAKKIATSTGAKHSAFVAMRKEFNEQWLPKWKNQGRLSDDGWISGLGVRDWVTEAQNASSLVIGGLEEGPRKQVKGALEDFAEDMWHKHLGDVSKRDPRLVQNIREYDRRASGLIAIKEVMEQRARKDQEGLMGFAKKREGQIDKLMAGGAGVGVAMGRPIEAATGLAAYQAAKKIPAAASAINDRLLVPIQRAAMNGESWAIVANQAAEVGVPQGVARAIWSSAQRARGAQSQETSAPPETRIQKAKAAVSDTIFGEKATSTSVR